MRNVWCVFSMLVATAAAGSRAQDAALPPEDQASFRVEAFSSLHEVRVLDEAGEVVRGLRLEDFRALEAGLARPVTFFRERGDYPITLACLVDTGSNMSPRAVAIARELIFELIHRLKPRDQILLAAYHDRVYPLAPLTRDRLELVEGLRNLAATGRRGGWARLSRLFASDAWTGPAVDEVLIGLKRSAEGEKFVLVVSAGFGNIGDATLDHLRLAGARFIAVAVDNRAGDLFGMGGDQTARRRIVEKTGGISYGAEQVLERIDQLRDFLAHHCLVAFEPADPEKPALDEVEFQIAGQPGYTVLFTHRTRSSSAFY